jgi:hypothetical protein
MQMKISFDPDMIREYAKCMPSWFNPEWATYLTETATDEELTMIGEGILDDDEMWYLINRLIAKHAQDHFQSIIDGNIDRDILSPEVRESLPELMFFPVPS